MAKAKRKTQATASEVASSRTDPNHRASDGTVWGFLTSKSVRETVEALVVAFVLTFLFRTFEAEAFVIPTGSMAPTLMGQHKDIDCPQCGYSYQAGASSEAEDLQQQRAGGPRTVIAATCPMCRFQASVDNGTAAGRAFPTYGGDRILVSKTSYEFGEPRRWQVLVFKYPNEAQTNYIKRLVGLPRETVRLWHGDLYVKPQGESEFRLERREPSTIIAMSQTVYDNDYVDDTMTQRGWPVRWQPWPTEVAPAEGNWTTADGSRSYTIDGSSSETRWLRYRHFTPSLSDWSRMAAGPLPSEERPKASLITDFYAYDTSVQRGDPLDQAQMLGLHWVGDLLLECQLDLRASGGEVLLELVKGGRHFGCTFDGESGQARLSIDGLDAYHPTARTTVRGAGSHDVMFANVDEQLLLWVDGRPVAFDAPTTYGPLNNDQPRASAEDLGDLAPAGVGARSAEVTVRHLRLRRDIYYIAATVGGPLADYASESPLLHMNYQELADFWSSPAQWEPPKRMSPFDQRREALFTLAADQFFVLGDNSPMSMDARLWGGEPYVSRELLVGKALFIFWPHSFNRIPGTSIPLPYFPNFARMRFIR